MQRPPASTTKIMTAILLLENTKPTDIIMASKKAQATKGSSLNLKWGEKVSSQDMLYAILLRSANDGCVAAAEHIAGSEQKFVEMMNNKAKKIGATNTQFDNCNGLNDDIHLTTARDLSLIARYACRYPEFNKATRTKWYTITRSSKNKDVKLQNHAKFLWKYPDADGIKTGWTVPAGKCFVGGATRDGWRLISVVLNSKDIVADTIAIMNYGFDSFEKVSIVSGGSIISTIRVEDGTKPNLNVGSQLPVSACFPKGAPRQLEYKFNVATARAPIKNGDLVGTFEVFSNRVAVARGNLIALQDVNAKLGSVAILKWWTLPVALMIGIVILRYGTTITKSTRRRRHRVKTSMRAHNRRR